MKCRDSRGSEEKHGGIVVSVDKTDQMSGFGTDGLNMRSPGEVRGENNPQVFVRIIIRVQVGGCLGKAAGGRKQRFYK